MPLKNENLRETASSTSWEVIRYKVLSFGLVNSLSDFNQAVLGVGLLQEMQSVGIFVDNILSSATLEEHL